jgi:hypothetical protein
MYLQQESQLIYIPFDHLAETHASPEAAQALGKSLMSIIDLASGEDAEHAFDRFPTPSSLANEPQQRPEWFVLATLIPVLAIPQADNYRDLVFNALLAIRHSLTLFERGGTAPWPTQRMKDFDKAVLGILNGKA